MFRKHGSHVPYTQEQIGEQIHTISKLQEQRTKGKTPAEQARSTQAIEVAQEVLTFMLQKIELYLTKQ